MKFAINLFHKIKQNSVNSLVIFTTALLLTACQTLSVQNIASTSGFGGTGVIEEDPSSGFGGTGRASSGFGGTGVIGTITQFGSIWVNGIEIGYGDKTEISSDLIKGDSLKLGQQVILETLPREDKALTKAIHIYYPLAGKITELTETGLIINDQFQVLITAETKLDVGIHLNIGEFIALSGYQTADNEWIATRLNLNKSELKFYHPRPTRVFSESIERVIIETNNKQLSQWKTLSKKRLFFGEKLAQSKRLIVEGRLQKGKIESPVMTVYEAYVFRKVFENQKHKRAQEYFQTPKGQADLQNLQKEQMEVMQMQKEQQNIIVERLEQQRQLQDIRDQLQQLQDLKEQKRGNAP